MTQAALDLTGVSKHFGSVRALDGATVQVKGGEVHGLLGQNGSGKSTLVKILTGFHAPDAADRAEVWGTALDFPIGSPRDVGIAVIHQDLALVDTMTVAENIGISTGFDRRALAPVAWRKERGTAGDLVRQLGFELDPDAPVSSLSAAERAAVAVARAIRELRSEDDHRQLLILDEPTAYLPAEEARKITRLMRSVADRGAAVIFISHRLAEVMAACDSVTVLRDGRTVGQMDIAETSPREIINLMLGRELGDFYPERAPAPRPDVLLEVSDLHADVLQGVSLQVHAGEILGVTGLVGQGQAELPYLVAGSRRADAGEISLDGRRVGSTRLDARIRDGIILVPANRKRDGVWLEASAAENMSLPIIGRYMAGGALRGSLERAAARKGMQQLGVRPPEPARALAQFSGGNQQKIVLAKWLQCAPRVLVLDEPTQGVDAGAKREILELIGRVAADGAGVLFCSSDYEEVANVCHRVVVLSDGRIQAELAGDHVAEHAILEACHAAATH